MAGIDFFLAGDAGNYSGVYSWFCLWLPLTPGCPATLLILFRRDEKLLVDLQIGILQIVQTYDFREVRLVILRDFG